MWLTFEQLMYRRDDELALRAHFQGTNQVDKRILHGEIAISMEPSNVFYCDLYDYLFEKYIIKQRQAHMILELQRQMPRYVLRQA